MNQKVYHTLEYYKILERLADYASCEEAKDRCHKLVPLTDPAEIAHLQETTADALSRLYRGSGISFSGVHNVNASLKRLDIGGTLNTTEATATMKKQIPCHRFFHRSSRFLPFWMKSAAVLSGKTKLQTTPLRHFLKSVNPSGG